MLLGWNQGYGGYRSICMWMTITIVPQCLLKQCLLEHVVPVPPVPLPLEPVTDVVPGIARQPAETVLRLIAMVETLRKLGRFPLTSKGLPTRPFLSKLTRMLGWEAALAADALAPLPDATLFFFWLLAGLGFYEPHPDGTGMGLASRDDRLFRSFV